MKEHGAFKQCYKIGERHIFAFCSWSYKHTYTHPPKCFIRMKLQISKKRKADFLIANRENYASISENKFR